MTIEKFACELISPKGRYGRTQFVLAELYRGVALGICYMLYLADLKWLMATALPFAVWIGIVGTIKRFNDLRLSSTYILLSLTVIAFGFGLAWQFRLWPLIFVGLAPYLGYVCLAPGKPE